jgi:tRNA A22 N-methylase
MPSSDKTTTSSSRVGEALSVRFKALQKHWVNHKHVWDIGCDHGLLGLSFVAYESVQKVHLVDPSGPVIENLKKKLEDSYITKGKILIIHSKGQELKIESLSNCIFIAGMGGKEIGEIVTKLLPQLDSSSRIVISPHRKILELRELLGQLPVSLISEEVIFENEQYYQILCLSPELGRKVPSFGEEMWESEVGRRYLEHQLKHFGPHTDEASKAYVNFLMTSKSLESSL